MEQHKLIICVLLILSSTTSAYNILGVFMHPGKSHFDMFLPMVQGLADKGHNITVISMFPESNPPPNYRDVVLNKADGMKDGVDLAWFENPKPLTHYLEIMFLIEWGLSTCENALSSPQLQKFIQSNTVDFDLVILESFNTECPLGLAYKIQPDVPIISLSSCPLMSWHYQRIALPHITSYMPVLFSGSSEKMNFIQRLQNWFTIHTHNIMYPFFAHGPTNKLLEKYLGPGIPHVDELTKNTKLMMVNQHYSLGGPKPLPTAVIEVGGIHIKEAKPLTPELNKFLDNAKEGVVVVSWGSMVRASSMPDYRREAILNALGQLKQKVIWKWENSSVPNKPDNVHILQWLPQRDILCHKNVRAFWGHGGLLGSSEAAYCGVPMVVTPQYGDQYVNAAALEHRGMGITLPFRQITKETAFAALNKALSRSFMRKAKAVSYSYTHRQNTPLETAIYWAEHIAETGGTLVQSEAVHLPWYIYHSLDVWVFVILVTIVISFLFVLMMKKVCSKFMTKKVKTE